MNKAKPARIETDIHAAYEKWSEIYDAQPNKTRDLSTLALKQLVPDLSGLAVVEGGCGTGGNSAWLAPQCKQLIGLDLSGGMLKVAKAKVPLPNVQFIRCDILEHWPLAGGVADLILINLVLEHIETLAPVFRNAARAMRPGARLIITEFHPNRVAAGGQARIKREGEDDEHIINFVHPIDEFIAAADTAGLRLESSAEWAKTLLGERAGDTDDSEPLIVTFCFSNPPPQA